MPQYVYKVKKSPQEVVTGFLEADNERIALSKLREMGYHPLMITEQEQKKPLLSLPAFNFLKGIRRKEVNLFVRQLSDLINAGLPLTRSLEILKAQTPNKALKGVVEDLKRQVQEGISFSEALSAHPKVFPPIFSSMVKAGEAGGMLEEVLLRIADLGDEEEELRGRVKTALIYPSFLAIVGLTTIFIMLSFVFPTFISLFEDMGQDLPAPTRLLIAICSFMDRFWWTFLLLLGLGIVSLKRYYADPKGRRLIDLYRLKIPIYGELVKKVEIARFAHILGALLDNGVSMLQSLRTVMDTLSNQVIIDDLAEIYEEVSRGESLAQGLLRSPIFPPMVGNMLAVGEESGNLGGLAHKVASSYEREVERTVKVVTSLLEPVLILVLGSMVGFLVISMLLPLFQLSTLVG